MRLERFKVLVGGQVVEVEAHQKSQTVWIASGSYLDLNFEVKGGTDRAAVDAWREAAEYRRN